MEFPAISILTPTWNRKEFLPLMIHNIKNMDYDKNKLEWIIADDHPTNPLFKTNAEVNQVKKEIYPITFKYIYDKKRHLSIGEKRNLLVKSASFKICAFMDDDDIYNCSYLKHSIDVMKQGKYSCVGSNQMLFIFPHHNYQVSHIQCSAKRQAHEATMVFTKKYFRSMGGFPKSSKGEGAKFIDFNEKNVGLTDITYIMFCVCHQGNTCQKDIFLDNKVECNLDMECEKIKILKSIFEKKM
jgi:glycosyltransferase involved in cell wall biosynthesis